MNSASRTIQEAFVASLLLIAGDSDAAKLEEGRVASQLLVMEGK
jgi:hypothetical protein